MSRLGWASQGAAGMVSSGGGFYVPVRFALAGMPSCGEFGQARARRVKAGVLGHG